MTPRQTLDLIRRDLGITARTKLSGALVLDAVCRRAQYGDYGAESSRLFAACYGIAHALQTGRLHGRLHLAVERLDCRGTAALIAAVASACEVSGQVSAWLIANEGVILPAA